MKKILSLITGLFLWITTSQAQELSIENYVNYLFICVPPPQPAACLQQRPGTDRRHYHKLPQTTHTSHIKTHVLLELCINVTFPTCFYFLDNG